ncbi:type VI secretion system-associated protein TagF [Psychromonas sp. Urea-02u-13]|uniref:type VI secretion system-associated protein TagF n=1 Tax=Psychromonas sp. Urea-02u-13 TaxID=2058326 RepID=UPI0012FF3505|nr:type VI secretion system-associated protein TagF [Psychromonas sp. Urea-02u-13]
MNNEQTLGVYGKLPSHGDFVHRNLPTKFISTWDEWLQQFVSGSQEKMGEHWLDVYLTSPIWRFVLSDGIIDENHWAGIVLPSVDQVGRYYPFSMVIPLSSTINPFEFLSANSYWFEQIEELALRALDGQISLDELVVMTEHRKSMLPMAYRKTGQRISGNSSQQINLQFAEELPSNAYAHLLDSLLTSNMGAYSLWSTSGSENIAPCLVNTRGLPSSSQIPAMMDGNWAHWGWTQPYTAND